ncbi:hypothetical protein CC86DRAFT_407323 [Ophiobolus disseminans]|uniref:Uncharacterized protein n=1 Tax=Ophiobolus disseminans TaxID=1469910 RepID=A0A6A6ZXN2_9PLEO|nr:hypothetical protein CC86DRAFT_407323 [Ophiobolus disseminans]
MRHLTPIFRQIIDAGVQLHVHMMRNYHWMAAIKLFEHDLGMSLNVEDMLERVTNRNLALLAAGILCSCHFDEEEDKVIDPFALMDADEDEYPWSGY